MSSVITNSDNQVVSFDGADAVEAFRLKILISGLKFEIACPKVKFMRGGVLKPAKAITGLKTNDKAKHLAKAEEMLAAAVAKCEIVNK
jgi:hypothetical protein